MNSKPRPLKNTPNVRKVVAARFAILAVPNGSGVGGAVGVLTDPAKLSALSREAIAWTRTAIDLVREALGEKDADDDKIAGMIVARIEEKTRERKAAAAAQAQARPKAE